MKYIDADKLIAEIEKRLKNVRDYMNGAGMKYKGPKYFKTQGKESSYDALLSLITSLQQEQSQVVDASKTLDGLVEEVKRYYSENYAYITSDQPTLSILTNIARHFYELGLKARKEE